MPKPTTEERKTNAINKTLTNWDLSDIRGALGRLWPMKRTGRGKRGYATVIDFQTQMEDPRELPVTYLENLALLSEETPENHPKALAKLNETANKRQDFGRNLKTAFEVTTQDIKDITAHFVALRKRRDPTSEESSHGSDEAETVNDNDDAYSVALATKTDILMMSNQDIGTRYAQVITQALQPKIAALQNDLLAVAEARALNNLQQHVTGLIEAPVKPLKRRIEDLEEEAGKKKAKK